MVMVKQAVGPPAPLRRARLGVALTFLVTGVIFGTWAARLPAIKLALGLTEGELGIAFMGLNAGAVVGLQLGGALVPRSGSRAALRLALPAYVVTLSGPALAGDLATLTVGLFLLAAVNSVVDVAMNAHGVAVEHRLGRPVMSSLHAMYSLGGTAGAVLGALAATIGLGRTPHFLLVAGAGLAVAVGATGMLLPSQADAAGPGPRDGRRRTIVATLFDGWSGRTLALGVVSFGLLLAEGSVYDWAAVYLRDGAGATAGVAAAGVGVFSAAMTVGRLAGDRVAARLGPVAAFRSGALLAGLGFGTALLVGTPLAGLAGLGLFGAGLSLTFPLAISAAGRSHGSPATAVARVSTLGYLGAFVGPGLIGAAAGPFGLPAALALPAMLVTGAALTARVVRRSSE